MNANKVVKLVSKHGTSQLSVLKRVRFGHYVIKQPV